MTKHTCNRQGCKSRPLSPGLSATQRDVYDMLTQEFLTPAKAAIRRQCSSQAIYKVIKQLRRKGLITNANIEVAKSHGTLQPTTKLKHGIRLHGQEFNIKIIHKTAAYKDILSRCNKLDVDGNTIRLYRDSVEVYSGHSFDGDTAQVATSRSFVYWNRFMPRLESELKLVLVRPRTQNVTLVYQEYAEINNELATKCNADKDKIRAYTTDEGKLWFLIDNSFNLNEAETVGGTAKQDMEDTVQPFFNDLRDHPLPLPSDLVRMVAATQKQLQHSIKELAASTVATNKQLSSVLDLIKPIENDEGVSDVKRPHYIG